VVGAAGIPGVDPDQPVAAVTLNSVARLFPLRLSAEDAGRRLQEEWLPSTPSASQAGGEP